MKNNASVRCAYYNKYKYILAKRINFTMQNERSSCIVDINQRSKFILSLFFFFFKLFIWTCDEDEEDTGRDWKKKKEKEFIKTFSSKCLIDGQSSKWYDS